MVLASFLIGYGNGGPCNWFSSRATTQHEKARNAYVEELLKTEAREKQTKQQRKARRAIQAQKKSEADTETKARCRQEAKSKAADEAAARKAREESEVNVKREKEIARRQAETETHAAAVSKALPSFEELDTATKSGGSNGNVEARVPERSELSRSFECPIR